MFVSEVYEYAAVDRIVVIADVHGDLKRFKKILQDANIINDNLEWIAQPADTIVVQLGDQVDSINRSPDIADWEVLDDTNMIYFTASLDNIARAKGGRMISLIGNHELMNVIGNFSYVSPQSNVPSRSKAFMPTGQLSPILGNRPVVLKIGEHFFCHAGIKKHHLDLLDSHNKSISYVNDLWKQLMVTNRIEIEDKELFDKILLDTDGILWTRNVDTPDDFENVLRRLGCSYVYVGHTPVPSIQIVNDRLWLLDTGLSRAFGSKSFQYIEIVNDSINIKDCTDIKK